MPIDLSSEAVVTLSEAAALLPRRRGGRKSHVSCIYRWAKHGLGGVRLETLQVGGTLCTSREALQRFCDRRTQTSQSHSPKALPAANRAADIAGEELDRLGI